MELEWKKDQSEALTEYNRELKNSREKRYREAHRDQERERWKRWADANPERLKELHNEANKRYAERVAKGEVAGGRKPVAMLSEEELKLRREYERERKRAERARKRALNPPKPPKPKKAKPATPPPAYYPQEALGSVVLLHGTEVDFASAWAHTDADLRERIITQLPSATDQELLDAYCLLHMERYGEPFDF